MGESKGGSEKSFWGNLFGGKKETSALEDSKRLAEEFKNIGTGSPKNEVKPVGSFLDIKSDATAMPIDVKQERKEVLDEALLTTGVPSDVDAELNQSERFLSSDEFQRWIDSAASSVNGESVGVGEEQIQDQKVKEITSDPLLEVQKSPTEALIKFKEALRKNAKNIARVVLACVIVGLGSTVVNKNTENRPPTSQILPPTSSVIQQSPDDSAGPGFVPDDTIPNFNQPAVMPGLDGKSPADDFLSQTNPRDIFEPQGDMKGAANPLIGGGVDLAKPAVGPDLTQRAPGLADGANNADKTLGDTDIGATTITPPPPDKIERGDLAPKTLLSDPHNTNFKNEHFQDLEAGKAHDIAKEILDGYLNNPAKNTKGVTLTPEQNEQVIDAVNKEIIKQGYANLDGSIDKDKEANVRMFDPMKVVPEAIDTVLAGQTTVSQSPDMMKIPTLNDIPTPIDNITRNGSLTPIATGEVFGPKVELTSVDNIKPIADAANADSEIDKGKTEESTNPLKDVLANPNITIDKIEPAPPSTAQVIAKISGEKPDLTSNELSKLRPGMDNALPALEDDSAGAVSVAPAPVTKLEVGAPLIVPDNSEPLVDPNIGRKAFTGLFGRGVMSAEEADKAGAVKWVPGQKVAPKPQGSGIKWPSRSSSEVVKSENVVTADSGDFPGDYKTSKESSDFSEQATKEAALKSPAEREKAARTFLRQSEKLVAKNPDAKIAEAQLDETKMKLLTLTSGTSAENAQKFNAIWNRIFVVLQEKGAGAVADLAKDIKDHPDRVSQHFPGLVPDSADKPAVAPTEVGASSPDGEWVGVEMTRGKFKWAPVILEFLKNWDFRGKLYIGLKTIINATDNSAENLQGK
ncbi:MAG: hypothetical protein WC227_00925 [Patescibacteria group bacterium]|jgi:hypothetical protein